MLITLSEDLTLLNMHFMHISINPQTFHKMTSICSVRRLLIFKIPELVRKNRSGHNYSPYFKKHIITTMHFDCVGCCF